MFKWLGWLGCSVGQVDHGVWVVGMVTDVRVVFCSGSAGCSLVTMFGVVWWSGKLGWLGQFIWLIGWMVSVVKLVKWLGCWNQVVRMIYQILDRMEVVSWGMNAILQKIKQNRYNFFTSQFFLPGHVYASVTDYHRLKLKGWMICLKIFNKISISDIFKSWFFGGHLLCDFGLKRWDL